MYPWYNIILPKTFDSLFTFLFYRTCWIVRSDGVQRGHSVFCNCRLVLGRSVQVRPWGSGVLGRLCRRVAALARRMCASVSSWCQKCQGVVIFWSETVFQEIYLWHFNWTVLFNVCRVAIQKTADVYWLLENLSTTWQ